MYVAFIVLSCGLLVSGQTGTEPIPLMPDSVQSTTQSNVSPAPSQCLSVNQWNKLEGLCINRSHCDYGTPAIDFTLYVPRGLKRMTFFLSQGSQEHPCFLSRPVYSSLFGAMSHLNLSKMLMSPPCPADKVCCPIQYIIPDTPPKDGLQSHYNQNGDDSDESDLSDY